MCRDWIGMNNSGVWSWWSELNRRLAGFYPAHPYTPLSCGPDLNRQPAVYETAAPPLSYRSESGRRACSTAESTSLASGETVTKRSASDYEFKEKSGNEQTGRGWGLFHGFVENDKRRIVPQILAVAESGQAIHEPGFHLLGTVSCRVQNGLH